MSGARKGRIVLTLLGVLFLLLFAFHGFFFLLHPVSPFFTKLSKLMVFPAAVVLDMPVPYSCVAERTHEFADFYEEETKREHFARALEKCVYEGAVRAVAQKLEVKNERDPLILAQKAEAAVLAAQSYQDEPRARLNDLKKRFADGMPFADAARRYSEDVSGGSGGDLGVFYLDSLPEWLSIAARLEDDEVSEVIEGVDAYWIIAVGERGGSGEASWVRLLGIAAKKVTLRTILSEELRQNPPWIFVW